MLGIGREKESSFLPKQRDKVDLHLRVVSMKQREEGYQGTLKEVPSLTGSSFIFFTPSGSKASWELAQFAFLKTVSRPTP